MLFLLAALLWLLCQAEACANDSAIPTFTLIERIPISKLPIHNHTRISFLVPQEDVWFRSSCCDRIRILDGKYCFASLLTIADTLGNGGYIEVLLSKNQTYTVQFPVEEDDVWPPTTASTLIKCFIPPFVFIFCAVGILQAQRATFSVATEDSATIRNAKRLGLMALILTFVLLCTTWAIPYGAAAYLIVCVLFLGPTADDKSWMDRANYGVFCLALNLFGGIYNLIVLCQGELLLPFDSKDPIELRLTYAIIAITSQVGLILILLAVGSTKAVWVAHCPYCNFVEEDIHRYRCTGCAVVSAAPGKVRLCPSCNASVRETSMCI